MLQAGRKELFFWGGYGASSFYIFLLYFPGAILGASIEGAKLEENKRAAQRFYQKELSSREILTSYPAEETATRNLTRLLEKLIKERGN